MELSKHKQVTYEYPSNSYIESLKKQRFKTLNQAINLIHKAPPSQTRIIDRYKLKSFDGKNIHLFQCWRQQCKSHILFKSHINNKPDILNKVQFQIYEIKNIHNHKDPNLIIGPRNDKKRPKHFPVLEKGSGSEDIQIDKFEYIRHRLRKYNISNFFRDYINCFSTSIQQKRDTKLPYTLPQIFKSKPFLVTLKIGFKCLNEKKKTYFFIIELFSFGQLFTEVRFVTSLKSKNPQIYLYTLTLIYILLNSIRNCTILTQEETFRLITRTKEDANEILEEKKMQQQKFIKFFMNLQNDFFTDCTSYVKKQKCYNSGHIQKHYVEDRQRDYDRRKYVPSDSEDHSHDSFMSTDEEKNKFGLSPFMKKSYIKLQQLQSRELRSLKNKCLIAQSTYKEATMGKNGQWHICEQKPSVIQKINDLFHIQEINRLKKEKNKEISFCKDENIIALSSEDSDDDGKMQQKNQKNGENKQKQQDNYLNQVLSIMYGDLQIRELKEQQKGRVERKQQKLVMIGEEEQKVQRRQKVNNRSLQDSRVFVGHGKIKRRLDQLVSQIKPSQLRQWDRISSSESISESSSESSQSQESIEEEKGMK